MKQMKKVIIELYIPQEYAASELFAAAICASIKDSPYIKKKVKKCIVDNNIKIVE